jgi:ubiquinone biosynthesis protein Coq4
MTDGRFTLANLFVAVRAFGGLIRNPHDLRNFEKLEQALLALASARERARIAACYRGSPELRPMLESRFLSTDHDIAALLQCPAGTFGHAYAHFITDNNLSVDYYPRAEVSDDLMYFRARMLQMHDLWHVLLGAAPDVPGELEVIGFSIGQLERTLRRERLAVAFFYMMAVAYLTHTAIVRPRAFLTRARRFLQGRKTGLELRPFFAVQWERLWRVPLEMVRATCVVKASLPGRGLAVRPASAALPAATLP